MPSTMSEKNESYGFLTVLEHSRFGLFGGYLLLNAVGRPLEFHCTTPVKPNRAQVILYGNTLNSFLYGEQIGQTLIKKSRLEPIAVFTDRAGVLAAQEFVSFPVIFLPEHGSEEEESSDPEPSGALTGRRAVSLAGKDLYLPDQMGFSAEEIARTLSGKLDSLDLTEPFSRIRLAIEEAQRAA